MPFLKTIIATTLFCSLLAIAYAGSPDSVIPSTRQNEFLDSKGRPQYSQNSIKLINYVDDKFSKTYDQKIAVDPLFYGNLEITVKEGFDKMAEFSMAEKIYNVDLLAYGKSEVTGDEAFSVLSDVIKGTDLTGVTSSNWATSDPANCFEATERMATLLKTLNTGNPIP